MSRAKLSTATVLSLFAALCPPAAAQTMSAADILAKVEEKVGGVNEYQALLNDPDPNRSMAAMEVMLGSGDPALVRMASDFGLYSPNPSVRYTALKAFFDSAPLLRLQIDGSGVKERDDFSRDIRNLEGSVGSDAVGFATIKIREFDPEAACYIEATYNDCAVRLTETEISISPWRNRWYRLTLNDQGQLIGEIDFDPPAPVTIPVTQ